jgi:hypothetical protein
MVHLIIVVVAVVAIVTDLVLGPADREADQPPDRPGHEDERFHFKYGSEPPGGGGSGTISGAS